MQNPLISLPLLCTPNSTFLNVDENGWYAGPLTTTNLINAYEADLVGGQPLVPFIMNHPSGVPGSMVCSVPMSISLGQISQLTGNLLQETQFHLWQTQGTFPMALDATRRKESGHAIFEIENVFANGSVTFTSPLFGKTVNLHKTKSEVFVTTGYQAGGFSALQKAMVSEYAGRTDVSTLSYALNSTGFSRTATILGLSGSNLAEMALDMANRVFAKLSFFDRSALGVLQIQTEHGLVDLAYEGGRWMLPGDLNLSSAQAVHILSRSTTTSKEPDSVNVNVPLFKLSFQKDAQTHKENVELTLNHSRSGTWQLSEDFARSFWIPIMNEALQAAARYRASLMNIVNPESIHDLAAGQMVQLLVTHNGGASQTCEATVESADSRHILFRFKSPIGEHTHVEIPVDSETTELPMGSQFWHVKCPAFLLTGLF